MKPSIKFSLLGGIVGAVVMFIAVVIIEWQLDKHPALDTQVVEHLESCGYPIDTLDESMYAFYIEDTKYIFDYYPKDQSYVRILAGFSADEYAEEDVKAACISVMRGKKNCIVIPELTERGWAVRISCESFIDSDEAIDTEIIDRAIRVLQQAEIQLFRELQGQHVDG